MIFAMKLKGKSTLNKGDLDQDMNKNRGNETHHVLLAYEFISYGPILLICTPPLPPPFPVDEIVSRGRQKHGISEGCRTEYQIFGGQVAKKQKFLKVVRFKVRFSEGKKQKSKKFLRVVGS